MTRRVAVLSVLVLAVACGRSGSEEADATTTSAAPTTAAPTTTTTLPPPEEAVYVVQPGDSLSAIALRFGVSVDDIADANAITDVNTLAVGQELRIPPSTTTTTGGPATSTTVAGGATSTTSSTTG